MKNKKFGVELVCGEVISILDLGEEIALTMKQRAKLDDGTFGHKEITIEIINIGEKTYADNFRKMRVSESSTERKSYLCVEIKERKDKNPIGRRFFYVGSGISFYEEDDETGTVKESYYLFTKIVKEAELKTSAKGNEMVNLSIPLKKNNKTSWITCRFIKTEKSKKTFDNSKKLLRKGSIALIKISKPDSYTSESGRKYWSCIGDSMELVEFAPRESMVQ